MSPADAVPSTSERAARPRLPGAIWALGFVSMLMDISSELVHSLLPVFMASVLGASMAAIGVVEGAAEGAASFMKVGSGWLSDRVGKRKALAVAGYALSAAVKPIFPLATSLGWVFAARFADRVGKGIRGVPRDALVADLAPPDARGAAYGLRQALDSVGAFLGPLLAIGLMRLWSDHITAALWVAVAPAASAVALLAASVREPAPGKRGAEPGRRLALADARRLPARYWRVVALGAVFSLARFSEAFVILRARDVGLPMAWAPAILVVMNVAYSLLAYPAGAAADRLSAGRVLMGGAAALAAADGVLALAGSAGAVFLGAALWGLHMACTQGLLAKLVADTAPADLRGTGFGVFHLVSGGALVLASALAGSLWSAFGAPAAFLAGGVLAALAVAGLIPRALGSALK